ncbi:MAG TPA: hypothetical protein VGO78_06985 [Acidimicrobiales bacterium]|nr:hypothetical protein [Acidimicrobiales bacterium]
MLVGSATPAEVRSDGSSWRARLRGHLPLLVAGVVGGMVALWAAYGLWPHGTPNLDELVYLNQADALRHGRLTYDASSHVPDFRPYLTGVVDDRVVFKYQALWPAWLALSLLVTGDHRAGLVVAGVLAALAFWLLGRELTGSRWWGTVTSVLVATSPIFVVHSGTALAYLPAAALASAGLAMLLRGERLASWRWRVGAGVVLGALFFHRPFDAVLVAVPAGLWLVLRARGRAWRPVLTVAVAALPFVLGWLACNQVVAGDGLKPAFTIDAPGDAFGFGTRSSWTPGRGRGLAADEIDYTVGAAAGTVGTFASITPVWIGGGLVTLALVVAAMVGGRRDARRWMLLGTVGAVVAGYFFWWGTANFVDFRLHRSLGPAYWLGAVGPLTALAVAGAKDAVDRWWAAPEWRPRPLLTALGVVAVVTVALQAAYVDDQLADARATRDRQQAPLDAGPEASVVLLPVAPGDPFVRAPVPGDLDGAARLQAPDLDVPDQRFRLLDRFPGRTLWAWLADRPSGTVLAPPRGYRLTRLTSTRAGQLDLAAAVTLPVPEATVTGAWLRTVDGDGDELARTPLAPGPTGRLSGSAVAGDDAAQNGGPDTTAPLAVGPVPAWLAIGARVDRGDGTVEIVELRWAVRAVEGQVEAVGPGLGHRSYSFPGGDRWLPEDVADRLSAGVAGLVEMPPIQHVGPLP